MGVKRVPRFPLKVLRMLRQMVIPAGMKSQHCRTGWSAVGKRQKHKVKNKEGAKSQTKRNGGDFFLRKIIIKYSSNWALVCKSFLMVTEDVWQSLGR